MPELPEVEVLARHLRPALHGKSIRSIRVNRPKILKPTTEMQLRRALTGAKFQGLTRRGKYLLFEFRAKGGKAVTLLGHLGMTGRMFVMRKGEALPKHAAVVCDLSKGTFVFEDTRYFGRMTLDLSSVEKLGPEPWDPKLTPEVFAKELKRSRQPVKVKLLDQSLIAGVGNIYASEALFRSKISPRLAANKLKFAQVERLLDAVRDVLSEAISCGSTVPLNFGTGKSDGLFYFGSAPGTEDYYEERLQVYDRSGKPCLICGSPILRIVQAARSTFFCKRCQKV
jgi:formamidopyrimidine-DNA glycosylase